MIIITIPNETKEILPMMNPIFEKYKIEDSDITIVSNEKCTDITVNIHSRAFDYSFLKDTSKEFPNCLIKHTP